MSKHTWKWHPASSVVGSLISWGDIAKGENVCAVMPQKDKKQTEEFARLISAAPDLLVELERLLIICKAQPQPILTVHEQETAEAMIRKAKGE